MSSQSSFVLFIRLSLAALFLLSATIPAKAGTSLAPGCDGCRLRGPDAARGVVVYSHGRSLTGEDSESPAPTYLRYLARDGWDVLRFNRPSAEDALPVSAQDLGRRVQALKAQGYRRVVLAGQSFGAFLSIMAAAETGSADAIIATAPAAFGNWRDSPDTWLMNATELYRRLGDLRHTPILLGFFQGDAYDPGGRGDMSSDLLARNGDPAVVIDRPDGLVGHLSAAGDRFVRRYGRCLTAFLDGAPNAETCPASRIIPAGRANAVNSKAAETPAATESATTDAAAPGRRDIATASIAP